MNNTSKFNFVNVSADFNPATTERLQLFHNISKKPKGPPAKVGMVNPMEFKDSEKNLKAVLNGNKSHELIPNIIRSINPQKLVSLLENVNSKVEFMSFEDYYQDEIKDSTNFYSNVELYLRELQFQQEYILNTTRNVQLGLVENPLQGKKAMSYENEQNGVEELTQEDYQKYKKKQQELDLSIGMKNIETINEFKNKILQKNQLLEEIAKENAEKWAKKVKEAEERERELKKQAIDAQQKANMAKLEQQEKERKQLEAHKKAVDEKLLELRLARQTKIEKENALKALKEKEDAEREVKQRKQAQEEWLKKLEFIRSKIAELSEQKQYQLELQKIEERKLEAQQEAIQEKNLQMRKKLEDAYKKQAKIELDNFMKLKEEREKQIIKQQEQAKKAEIEAKKAKEEWMKARVEAFIKGKEEYKAKQKAIQEELQAKKAEQARKHAEQQESERKNAKEIAIKEFIKRQQEVKKAWEIRREAKEKAIETKKEEERQLQKAKENSEKQAKIDAEKIAEQEEISSRISYEEKEEKLKEYRDWLLQKREQSTDKLQQKLREAKRMGNIIMNEHSYEKNRARNNIVNTEKKTDNFQGMTATELTKLLVVFNFDFYRTHYSDVKELSISECLKHYLTKGKKEGRIISKKHAQYITGVPDFDIIYYKNFHSNLHSLSLRQVCSHFISKGKEEKWKYKKDHFQPDNISITSDFIEQQSAISDLATCIHDAFDFVEEEYDETPNICIIFPYYEKKNHTKNQTNLAYFLKYAMNKSLWRNLHVTLLLMINGNECEVEIPLRDDIIVWKKDYNGEYDIGSYRLGIQYLERLHNKKFYEVYNYLFIMNSSVTGPFWPSGKNKHWLDPFLNKIHKENSIVCSPVINFLKAKDAGGPGPRCQTYCSLIKITRHSYDLLLNTKISKVCPNTLNDEFKNEGTMKYVFDIHSSMSDIILYGEYGFSRVFLENGYNISSLIYDNIDYHNSKNWGMYTDRVDRIDEYKIDYFYKAVFIKNNWSVGNSFKDSLPVLYDITIGSMYETMLWVDFMKESNMDIPLNYEISPLEPQGDFNIGIVDTESHNKGTKLLMGSWNTKEENYSLFGISEEVIVFPKSQETVHDICVYTHTDGDNKIKDYVIQGIKTLIVLGYDIIFCSSCSHVTNVDLPFPIQHYVFEPSVTDEYKHTHMLFNTLQKYDLKHYRHIFMLNSTIIFPVHGIQNMKKQIETVRKKGDFWSLYNTNGFICGNNTCFEISTRCRDTLVSFYSNQLKIIKDKSKLPGIIELNMVQALIKNKFSYNTIINYPNGIPLRACLQNNACFGMKLQSIQHYLRKSKNEIKNPVLRFLMRFLL